MSTLATLVVKLTADTGKFVDDMGSAEKGVGGFLKGVGSNVRTVGAVALGGLGVVAGAAAAAGAAIGKLAIDAAPLESVRKAFDGLTKSAGSSGPEMMAALEKGSSGMIAQRDLMLSYNKASQLVGASFAGQLPDAMKYLSKVSASTGQDMGFMLDSLVTGVGRLSPMILDNLGIQVNITEASEKWAVANGVLVDDMTKAQQQEAMMAMVMEKLAANTAAMPEVTGSAAAGMAQLQATFQNTKDEVGLAFLPTLSTLMGVVAEVGAAALPILTGALEILAPIVETVANAFAGLVSGILSGQDPIDALSQALQAILPPEVAQPIIGAITGIRDGIQKIIDAAAPYIEMAMQWIGQNVELQDVLIALGIAIAAVVVPALISVVSAALPIIATALLLIAAVALIRSAWEGDFLGIRTFVMETLEAIKAFWAEHGEAIIAKAQEIWEGIVAVFEWFKGVFMDVYDAFRLAFEGDWRGFGEKLREAWDKIWKMISSIGETTWAAIKKFFTETDWGAVARAIIDGIVRGIANGAKAIANAARSAARAALEAAKGFLGIGSPSRAFLEVGVNMMEGMTRGVARMQPRVRTQTEAAIHIPHIAGNASPGAGGVQINNYFGAGSIRSEDDIYRLAEEIARSLDLRGLQRNIA